MRRVMMVPTVVGTGVAMSPLSAGAGRRYTRPMAKRTRKDDPGPLGPPAIHAPWRSDYLENLGTAEKAAGPPRDDAGSFILAYWHAPGDDLRNHVIYRTADGIIFLNQYPYAGGHLLVALGEPRP